jgi:hypothetical protein
VAPALLPVFLQSKPHLLSSLFPLTHRYISDALPNPLKFHTNSLLPPLLYRSIVSPSDSSAPRCVQ